jgi:pilus retraction protein PilT
MRSTIGSSSATASDFIVERPSIGFRYDSPSAGTVAVAVRVMRRCPDARRPSFFASEVREPAPRPVLFCGPTGSGKSTTMAALIEIVNQSRAVHIVTIEDPVEYLYGRGRAVVEQIEIARDAASFSTALRHALRQDPDVLLVGEMRDLESISIALSAAETGHLVFSTLHTGDAPQTIDRLIDAFPDTQQNQVRQQLSLCLAGVVVRRSSRPPTAPRAHPAVRSSLRTIRCGTYPDWEGAPPIPR